MPPGPSPTPPRWRRGAQLTLDPYHAALAGELERLRALHPRVVLYDCHSIRSIIPPLFDGLLPQFNIGTNSGASCDPALAAAVEQVCDASGLSRVTNGRFKGGSITRRHGDPSRGVHAIQMELACRGYMRERLGRSRPSAWPTPFDPVYARPMAERCAASSRPAAFRAGRLIRPLTATRSPPRRP